jgi:hypothetical protein
MQCPTVTAAAAPRITVPPGTAPPLHTPPASVPLPVEQRRPPTPLRRGVRDAAADPDAEQEDRHWHGNQPGTGVLLPKADGAITLPAHAKRHGRSRLLTVGADLRRERRQCGLRGGGTARVHCLREGGRVGRRQGRRSAAASGALAEPARATAGWRRLRPSDTAACSAAGPGNDWRGGHALSPSSLVGARTRRRSPTNASRSQIHHQNKQSFLSRFDCSGATSLSGTTPAKTVQPQFHM